MDDEDGYFGESVAATYDDSSDVFDPGAVDAVADALAGLAGQGRALELGIGTGRIALPLARRGVPVHVIEVRVPDLRRLPPGQTVLPWHVSGKRWVFYSFDLATQAMRGHYIELTGGRGEYREMPFRYVWPAELD